MAVTPEDLQGFVNASPNDILRLTSALAEAVELVGQYVEAHAWEVEEGEDPIVVPGPILDRALLEVGADLFHRANAPNGILNQQYATNDGTVATPIRIGRDPMSPARPLLDPWLVPVGFA